MLLRGITTRIWHDLAPDHIPDDINWNAFTMRLIGLWPVKKDSIARKIMTSFIFIAVCIIFPATQFLNVFVATTVDELVGALFLSITHFTIGLRTFSFYVQQNNLRKLFVIHAKMRRVCGDKSGLFERTARFNRKSFKFFVYLYLADWSVMTMQVICMGESTVWPSTRSLPYAFGQRPIVYWTVLMFQCLANFLLAILIGCLDPFVVALINMNCGHVEVLKQRLESLADSNQEYYAELIKCCRSYEKLLRYDAKIMRWVYLITPFSLFQMQILQAAGTNTVIWIFCSIRIQRAGDMFHRF